MYRKAVYNGSALPYNAIEDSHISKTSNRFTTATAYDDAGNVTQDTKFRNSNFGYDANGRMVATSSTIGDFSSSAVYDASGQRVATNMDGGWTFYIYDAFGKMVAEYGIPALDEGGVKYVLRDWQGSSRATLTNTGYVAARMDYTAFGENIGAGTGQRTVAQRFNAFVGIPQKYAQTERDAATGLDHTWFRKNDARAGRWTSPDPYNGSASIGNPQSFNRYSYVGNDPTNFVDPSGLVFCDASYGWGVCSQLMWGSGGMLTISTRFRGDPDGEHIRISSNAYFTPNFGGYTPRIRTLLTDEPLPFKNCGEFVDWLVKTAESRPYNIHDVHNRAKALGAGLMNLAFFGYDRHNHNGYDGFKPGLVEPGDGTPEGEQGADVYAHVMGMAGAYLTGVMTGGRVVGWISSGVDHFQNSVKGNAQGPAEVAGNVAGTRAGGHIWNFIRGDGNGDNLRKSLTEDLCE